MNVTRKNILSGGPAVVSIFDKKALTLLQPGALRDSSEKLTTDIYTEELPDGTIHQLGLTVAGEMEALQTTLPELQGLDAIIGNGCHIWIATDDRTTIIRDTDLTIGFDGKLSRKGANAAKIAFKLNGRKLTDAIWQMPGFFDVTGMIFLLNAALQKNAGTSLVLDASPYSRTITPVGYTGTSLLWPGNAYSCGFDGIATGLRIDETEMDGPEMIGAVDSNNRTFNSTTGDWVSTTGLNILTSGSGGTTGNGLRLQVGISPTTNLLRLSSDVQPLTIGASYDISLSAFYNTSWNGGPVIISIGGSSFSLVLTNSSQRFTFSFVASTTNPEIVITCKTAPSPADILRIDDVSLASISQLNLNEGERINAWLNRNFENGSVGNWAAAGNHAVTFSASGYSSSTGALKITSSGTGTPGANYSFLGTPYFQSLVAGKSYCIQFFAKAGTGGVYPIASMGGLGSSAQFTAVGTGGYTKCIWKFTAAAGDVGQQLRIFLSGTDATGTLIDDVSITECVSFSAYVFFREGNDPGVQSALISTQQSARGGVEIGLRNDTTKQAQGFVSDNDNAASVIGGAALNDGLPHMATLTYDHTTLRLYVDGVLVNSAVTATIGRVGTISGRFLAIGYRTSGFQYYNGQIMMAGVHRGMLMGDNDVARLYSTTKGLYA